MLFCCWVVVLEPNAFLTVSIIPVLFCCWVVVFEPNAFLTVSIIPVFDDVWGVVFAKVCCAVAACLLDDSHTPILYIKINFLFFDKYN